MQATEIPCWPEASRGDTAYVVHFDDLTQQMPQSRGIHVKFAGIVGNFTELLGHNSQNPVLRYEVLRALGSYIVGIHQSSRTMKPGAYWGQLKRARMFITQNFELHVLREAVRRHYAEDKDCAKVDGGQLESCVPSMDFTPAFHWGGINDWFTAFKLSSINLRASLLLSTVFPNVPGPANA
ncbi:hypothetical protein E4U34_002559 [Claviceps purpurea]|nr:hypothetical protein E4U34_002559 [Claviceps purpurea]